MTSAVDISNLSLTAVGSNVIQSFDEPNERSRKCKQLYPVARDAVLRAHDWGFARKNLVLALLVETFTEWDFAYSYPPDCAEARRILDVDGSQTGTSFDIDTDRIVQVGKVQFEIISNAAGTNRIIVTNKAEAELQYTKLITDTNMFDALFIEALADKLASMLAVPLTGKGQLLKQYSDQFRDKILNAKTVNANEGHRKPKDVNSFVRARG